MCAAMGCVSRDGTRCLRHPRACRISVLCQWAIWTAGVPCATGTPCLPATRSFAVCRTVLCGTDQQSLDCVACRARFALCGRVFRLGTSGRLGPLSLCGLRAGGFWFFCFGMAPCVVHGMPLVLLVTSPPIWSGAQLVLLPQRLVTRLGPTGRGCIWHAASHPAGYTYGSYGPALSLPPRFFHGKRLQTSETPAPEFPAPLSFFGRSAESLAILTKGCALVSFSIRLSTNRVTNGDIPYCSRGVAVITVDFESTNLSSNLSASFAFRSRHMRY
jgi:hypothetical protein